MVLFSEEIVIAILAILFIAIIVLVISRWLYQAQTALEKGRIRAEAMKDSPLDCDDYEIRE
ncbi:MULTISPECIES: hypothetical protein [Methanococcoides]|uniref:Uncharacterized protein n=1 Tax=Methanococcoides cohabitans TaxID=3136559 RepID=A0ABU9KS87_9EURY|nr:hypothetical protein [Methanococcoides methylutens]